MDAPSPTVNPITTARLSIMMFLELFVWGAWYVSAGVYMNSPEGGMADYSGWAYTVGPIAAVVSPFFVGILADRFFSAQIVLGLMHLLGGGFMFAAARFAEGEGKNPNLFIWMLLGHMLCYMPTLALSNTVAFRHIQNPRKQFPIIRVFGTLGWIVAGGWVVSKWMHADKSAMQFNVAGISAVTLGLYSFTLPNTPATQGEKKISVREVLGLDALKLFRSGSFSTFMICSMLLCIPLACYYSKAGAFVDAAGLHDPTYCMSFGQMSEIFFMLAMPLFFAFLGVKWMLGLGMLAWVIRYGLFAAASTTGTPWMIMAGILLHGICYDFFFVTGFIYVDERVPQAIRSQAQGLLVLFTQGIGLGVGAQIVQAIVQRFSADKATAANLNQQALDLQAQSTALANTDPAKSEDLWRRASDLLLQTVKWQDVWMYMAIAAGVVLVIFLVLFHDKSKKDAPSSVA